MDALHTWLLVGTGSIAGTFAFVLGWRRITRGLGGDEEAAEAARRGARRRVVRVDPRGR